MDVTAARVNALVRPLRTIALDPASKQEELRGQLRSLANDVRALGREDLVRWTDRAEASPDGHADEPLAELVQILAAEERELLQ
jgi:hypothetical protein